MSTKLDSAILLTLAYSDMFDYPLTEREIYQLLHTSKVFPEKIVKQHLDNLVKNQIEQHAAYYCLPGRKSIVELRKKRLKISQAKLTSVSQVIQLLGYIPTIRFVGISGSVAKNNADSNADIDLFIITKKNTLWFSRAVILLILELTGKRRKRQVTDSPNRLCLNYMIDETMLSFSDQRQDIYTSYEIIQLMPVFNQDLTYEKLIWQNVWINRYLAHNKRPVYTTCFNQSGIFRQLLSLVCRLLEPLARYLQLLIISRHITTETVNAHEAAFHPYDYRYMVLKRINLCEKNMKNYQLWDIDKERRFIYTRRDSRSLQNSVT